jgi:hypothetical protein
MGDAQLVPYPSSSLLEFNLSLTMPWPGSKSMHYTIRIPCESRAQDVLLVLTGSTRLHDVRFDAESLGARRAPTERDLKIGSLLFEPPQDAQVFDFPVVPSSECPSHAVITFATEVGVEGWVERSFETSGAATHSVQLPVVGNSENALGQVTTLPTFGGRWVSDYGIGVTVDAGPLSVEDRVDVARPPLAPTGGLDWTGAQSIQASAEWTDLTAESLGQFWLLMAGAAIGVGASILTGVGMDLARNRERPTKT